jgi:hypothetical protein
LVKKFTVPYIEFMSLSGCSDVVMGCAALRQDAIAIPALSWTGKVAYDNLVEIITAIGRYRYLGLTVNTY